MRIGKMRQYDISNAPGICSTIFVTGCTHNCEGCFNKEYQNFSAGEEWSNELHDKFVQMCSNPMVTAINILGGEPLQQGNELDCLLCDLSKLGKPIWMWTGYAYEEVSENPKLKYIDVLVDGKFENNLKDLSLKYRGSSNQRVIDMNKSRSSGRLELLDII